MTAPSESQGSRNLERWLKLADDLDDLGGDGIRPVFEWSEAPDAYIEGLVVVHIHYRIGAGGFDLNDDEWCVQLQAHSCQEVGPSGKDIVIRDDGGMSVRTGGDKGGVKGSMLVRVRKVTQSGEDVGLGGEGVGDIGSVDELVPVRSVVRLVPLNNCPMVGMDVTDQGAGPVSVPPVFPIERVADREAGAFFRFPSVPSSQLKDEVIQSDAKVQDDLPNHDVPARSQLGQGNNAPDEVDAGGVVGLLGYFCRHLFLELSSEYHVLSCEGHLPIESFKMLLCPVNPGPTTVKSTHGA